MTAGCRSWRIAVLASALVSSVAVAATTEALSPPKGCQQIGEHGVAPQPAAGTPGAFPPPQLEMRIPFEPTAFPSGGRNYLFYELYFRNLASGPLTLRRLEVIGSDAADAEPIAVIEAEQLEALSRPRGARTSSDKNGNHQFAADQGAVAFLCLAFDGNARVPEKLRHRVHVDTGVADGPLIGTHHSALKVLGPPLTGSNWLLSSAPSLDSHHRVGIFVTEGRALMSRRYAIDFLKSKDGATFSGDALDIRSYYAYGSEVLAVADGRVVAAKDGLPDSVPRTKAGFRTAVPITKDTIGGNFIVLDLGNGQFALYAHLQSGTLSVKVGARVRRGQVLARVAAR